MKRSYRKIGKALIAGAQTGYCRRRDKSKRHGSGGTLADTVSAGTDLFDRAKDVLQGLYKFSFETAQGSGCGVMFATEGGRLYGGDSGSCFAGQFRQQGNGVIADLKMSRFNHDPNFTPMFPVDNAMLHFEGAPRGRTFTSPAAPRRCRGLCSLSC